MSKKIMFSDKFGLTKAVLEGRKTQTRRIVPTRIIYMVTAYQEDYYAAALESISVEDAIYNITHGERMAKAPYYIGEEIAVAQNYNDVFHIVDDNKRAIIDKIDCNNKGWSNNMFVKPSLMPHRIKITNVRVERLQDICEEDCLKEGIEFAKGGYYTNYNKETNSRIWLGKTPKEAFSTLIDKTCGRGTWVSNPWVFVYDFELLK
ncbi:MAG: hypothetical protein MJZ30_05840 [Paludibacteraceae bacterium]|nr:hypothetical protein [Paludibacteraceae bacterium]